MFEKKCSILLLILCVSGALSAQKVGLSNFRIEFNEDCKCGDDRKLQKFLEQGRDRKNDKEERIEGWQNALDEDDNCAEAHYFLGLELIRAAGSSSGMAGLKAGMRKYSAAEKHLQRVAEICPDFHHDLYYFLGALASGAQDFADAVKYYDKYYKLSSESMDRLDDQREEEIKMDYEFCKFFAEAYANPVPFNPVKVANVCTEDDEFLPFISPDNESMLFTRRYSIESHVKASVISEKVQYKERFVQANRVNGKFEEGDPLPSPFNEDESFHYGGATVTIDNKHLYLTICVPTITGKMNCDIYSSDLQYGVDKKTGLKGYYWTELKNMGENINTEDGWEAQPSISADGNTLYFTTYREGTQMMDIYYSKRDANGVWQKAESIGPPINTEGNDKTPFMHSDSKTLYFASDGHLGFGGLDVFYVRQLEEGIWAKPENLGHPINTPEDEQAYAISTDGRKVYYSGKDPNNPQSIEIFSFDLHEKARPDKVVFVKGELKNEKGEPAKGAIVELKTMKSKNVSRVEVDPNDGKYAAVVRLEADENVVMNVKAENMAFQSKLIEVVKDDPDQKRMRMDDDSEVSTFQDVSMEVSEVKEGGVYRINDIYYSTNSAEISEKSKAILDEFALYLHENDEINIAIHGHTDNVGREDANLALSADRAFSVKQYLERQGVSGDRIQFKGFGESVPFTTNDTPEGRALNRRTEFIILKT